MHSPGCSILSSANARRWLATGLALFLCAAPLVRAEAPEPNRILKNIDFEERKLGNNEDLPMHWEKISGPGLPHYVNGILATDRARSGQYSFRFDLNGGSLIYRYDPQELPVLVGAHYRVQAFCQTTRLPLARARMTAYFVDQNGQPLTDVVRHSELYVSPSDTAGWKALTIELNADNSKAAFMAVELELLQPQQFEKSVLRDGALWQQDIHGSAWFDDVSVAQVPQATLATTAAANIFPLGQPPQLIVSISDLFTNDLQSRLTIVDAAGRTIYQRSGAIDLATGQAIGAQCLRVNLPLPALAPGWYNAILDLTSHGRDLGQHSTAIIQLGDRADPMPPDRRFGVIATDLQGRQLEQLPEILPLLAAGRVKIAVWTNQQDIEETDPAGFDSLLERLKAEGITPTGCLLGLPPTVAQKMGGNAWPRLLRVSGDSWQPQLAYLISRHANHLDRWQFGADGDDEFVSDPQMRQVYQVLYNAFAGLANNPDLAMPWPAWYDLGDQLPATVALSVPTQVLPENISLYTHDLQTESSGANHNLSLTIVPLPDNYSRAVRLRDLAQRVIYAAAGGASRIDLPLPFAIVDNGDDVQVEPSELFVIDRTLMRTLSGAVYKGRAPIADGVEALLFDKDGQGIMALWSRGAEPLPKPITLNLGPQPMKVDLWGGVTPLPRVGDNVSVNVGPMPFFLIGLDGVSAQIRASVAFDKPLLESSFQAHELHLTFANPSVNTLTGTLRLRPPLGWTITPATFQFAVNPSQNFDRSVVVEFPYNSFAGPKTVVADFTLDGDQSTEFRVPLTLTLGLTDVGMRSLALRDGADLVVQEMITNYGDKPIDYTAFAAYPGLTRQERLVGDLPAGRSTIKLYRFKNVKFIPGAFVRCGIRQIEGTRVLNEEVAIQ